MTINNLRDTIVPKSDQLNADDLIGTTQTITVTEVARGPVDQPLSVHYQGENGRPYKPCKSMRRVLIAAWGEDGSLWAGRSMTLFCDQSVKFGGQEVGGIRISHLSHIDRDLKLKITTTRGKRSDYMVRKIPAPAQQSAGNDPLAAHRKALQDAAMTGEMDELVKAWGAIPKNLQPQLVGEKDKCKDAIVAAQKAREASEPAGFNPATPEPEPEAQPQEEPPAATEEPEPADISRF